MRETTKTYLQIDLDAKKRLKKAVLQIPVVRSIYYKPYGNIKERDGCGIWVELISLFSLCRTYFQSS